MFSNLDLAKSDSFSWTQGINFEVNILPLTRTKSLREVEGEVIGWQGTGFAGMNV